MTAKTFAGLEEVLAGELSALRATDVRIENRAVSFQGDMRLLYQANLHLRSAIRVLLPVFQFQARNEREFYENVFAFDWENLLSVEDTLAVDAAVHSRVFTHSKYVALKTKDAIVDRLRERFGERPSVELNDPTLRIHVHIAGNDCTISLDSSGDSLHRRGYRLEADKAPLNEVLAAGLVLLSGWRADCSFIDPMCGAGTIAIEAALLACNIPPGIFRRKFGFQNWRDYNEGLWSGLRERAGDERRDFSHRIIAADRTKKAVSITRRNVESAGLGDVIEVRRESFQDSESPSEKNMLIMNPPYGERLEESDIEALYKQIGDTLKQRYKGSIAWILGCNLTANRKIGLKPTRRIPLKNGPLECRFLGYEIY